MAKANISCGNCFYSFNSANIQPCLTCYTFDKWVPMDIYKEDEEMKITTDGRDMTPHFEKAVYDFVNKPKHYMLFEDKGIEVRDVIAKLVEKLNSTWCPSNPLFASDYVQMMQYVMRFMDKNGKEDLKKARWYLDKLIESYEK